MADIFISYAREDEQRIRDLAQALEKQGWSVFWDRRIPAGLTWRDYIGKAMNEAGCIVVAWSKNSISSSWVIEEAEMGQQRGILVPVLLEPVLPPIGFRSIQAGDLTDWHPGDTSTTFSQLVQDISGVFRISKTVPPVNRQEGRDEIINSTASHRVPVNHKKQHSKTQMFIVLIGLLGVLGVALIANWDKVTLRSNMPERTTEKITADPTSSDIHPDNSKYLVSIYYFPRRENDALKIKQLLDAQKYVVNRIPAGDDIKQSEYLRSYLYFHKNDNEAMIRVRNLLEETLNQEFNVFRANELQPEKEIRIVLTHAELNN